MNRGYGTPTAIVAAALLLAAPMAQARGLSTSLLSSTAPSRTTTPMRTLGISTSNNNTAATTTEPLPIEAVLRTGPIPGPGGLPVTATVEVLGARAFLEGDILFDVNALDLLASTDDVTSYALSQPDLRWPDGIIPVEIALDFADKEGGLDTAGRIGLAVQHFDQHTPIRFVPRTNEDAYVRIVPRDRDASYVGRQGGKQDLFLRADCGVDSTSPAAAEERCTGIIIHELAHVAGLWHEMSRPDRNEHIVIHWDQIREDALHNFQFEAGFAIGEYDFDSIMHYGKNAYRCDGCGRTITPIWNGKSEPDIPIGQRERLSDGDVYALTTLYATYPPDHCEDGSCSDLWGTGFATFAPAKRVGDVNGDGKADVVGFDGDLLVAFSEGDRFAPASASLQGYCDGSLSACDLGDFNGDGLADAVMLDHGYAVVALSNGSSFDPGTLWLHANNALIGGRLLVGDLTGDGLDDLVVIQPDAVWVATSLGNAFAGLERWMDYQCGSFHGTCVLGDFDGRVNADGYRRDELVQIPRNGTIAFLYRPGCEGDTAGTVSEALAFAPTSLCAGGRSFQAAGFVALPMNPLAGLLTERTAALEDLDGDGLGDLTLFDRDEAFDRSWVTVYRQLAPGASALGLIQVSQDLHCSEGFGCAVADVDGDGLPEVIDYADSDGSPLFPRQPGELYVSGLTGKSWLPELPDLELSLDTGEASGGDGAGSGPSTTGTLGTVGSTETLH